VPVRAWIASSTCSSTTTPGTSGCPGKCPGRQGWSWGMVNCMQEGTTAPGQRIRGSAHHVAPHRRTDLAHLAQELQRVAVRRVGEQVAAQRVFAYGKAA